MPARSILSRFYTGVVAQATPGTPGTVAWGDCVSVANAGYIQPKSQNTTINVGGLVGAENQVVGKTWGELSELSLYLNTGSLAPFQAALAAAGGVYTVASGDNNYRFGGGIYSGMTGANAGRLSSSMATIQQHDGLHRYTLSDAIPTKFSLEAKDGEPIQASMSWVGRYAEVSGASITPNASMSGTTSIGINSVISLDGINLEWSEVSVDLGIKTATLDNAGAVDGIGGWDLVDLDPSITINPYALSVTNKDIWSAIKNATSVVFSWTFAPYTITATCKIDSQERSFDNDVGRQKLVLKPIFNSTTGALIKFTGF